MKDEELAEEYEKNTEPVEVNYYLKKRYSEKQIEQAFLAGLNAGKPKWHDLRKNPDDLPEIDELVYLFLNGVDDFPVVARRHILYGQKWVWDCKWGSGFTVSPLAGENYLWKEIVLPKGE